MSPLFLVSLGLSSVEITLIAICSLVFLITFGIASAKGDYQGLINATLESDRSNRGKNKT